MKLMKCLTVILLSALICATAMGQDSGLPDSLKLVLAVPPGYASNVPVIVECSIFVDIDTLIGTSFGWRWDNPNLKMDSAKAWGEFDALSIGPFFYEDDNINTTNSNRRALCTATGSGGPNVVHPNPSGWMRIATYYMTMTTWTTGNTLNIDTLTFNLATDYSFLAEEINLFEYDPVWKGPISISAECNCADSNNDNVTNILDLNYLVNRFFRGGPAPNCNIK